MTGLQRLIKCAAIVFAVFLSVSIIGGILGVAGLVGGFFAVNTVSEEMTTYPVTADVRNLSICVGAADLYIKEGDVFSVQSNLEHLKVEQEGDELIIEETREFGVTVNGAVLTIYVPADAVFENVSITTGAGRLTVEQLTSGTLDFELGAGDVSIISLIATKAAEIDGGAGRITIADGSVQNLNLSMGVGQLNLTSALTGVCQLDLGIGQSDITLLGAKDDYKLEIEKGVGTVIVDGETVTNHESSGTGANNVELNGGIGTVSVRFIEAEDE